MAFGIRIPVSDVNHFWEVLTLLEFMRLVIKLQMGLNLIIYLPKSEILMISRSLAWTSAVKLWVSLAGFNFEQDDPGNNFHILVFGFFNIEKLS